LQIVVFFIVVGKIFRESSSELNCVRILMEDIADDSWNVQRSGKMYNTAANW